MLLQSQSLTARAARGRPVAEPVQVSALDFDKQNNAAGSDYGLEWTGSNMLPRFNHTIIWKAFYVQQTGYYALMWHIRADDTWGGGDGTAKYFYGTHPYPGEGAGPDGNPIVSYGSTGTVHCHEIADGNDKIATPGGSTLTVVKGVWLSQARTVEQVGSDYVHTYWPDIEGNPSLSIVHTRPTSDYVTPAQPTLKFRIGSSPWTASGSANSEAPSCRLRFIKKYSAAKSLSFIQGRLAIEADETTDADRWYSCINPTPTDVSDKSGMGRNPAWANANRPILWTP